VGLSARGIAPLRTLGTTANETELRVDYPGGAQVRLYGGRQPDALRGIYLDGVVLDEFATWTRASGPRSSAGARRPPGWAVFIGTPKGATAFFELWRRSQTEPTGSR